MQYSTLQTNYLQSQAHVLDIHDSHFCLASRQTHAIAVVAIHPQHCANRGDECTKAQQ